MPSPVLLKKENKNLPDFFTITINYLTGKTETLDIVEITYVEKLFNGNQIMAEHYDTYRIWKHDNKFKEIPRASVESIDYDGKYTEIIEASRAKKEGCN